MARIPQERIDAMKRQVDLVALVQSHGVVLKQHGRNWKGICPFHDDHDPSLVVTPDKRLWNCLGCDAGGDAYQWMMKTAKVSFRRAHEILSDRFGGGSEIPPTTSKGLEIPVDLEAEGQTLLHQVVDYYHARLNENPAALAYLEKRGIGDREAIDRFRIGFSDRTLGMRLPARLLKSGAKIRKTLQDLGIFRQSGHEHFTGSIVFPIFDAQGNVCEIYGRKITKGLHKSSPIHTYLDSESRPTLSRGVFNFDQPINGDEVILCESIIDALTFWCAGYHNVTTSYGTNGFNAQDHLAAYERNNIKKVFIAYDNDESGNEKGQQVAKRLLASGYETSRVKFPAGMDVNQYARKVTPAAQSLGLVLRKADWLGKGELLSLASKTKEAAKEEKLGSVCEANGKAYVAAKEKTPEKESTKAAPSSLVASPEPAVAADPTPKPAASKTVEATLKEGQVEIEQGNRRYRIRGLERNLSLDQLKVNLLVSKGDLLHVDTFDLYAARPRAAFARAASTELSVEENTIKRDLGKILLKLEELQDTQMALALEKQEKKPTLTDPEKAAALELLKLPNLMERIAEDFETCGVVGETTNKLVGYLAAASRKLDQPLAIVIQSSSAAGKSLLMEAVLAMVPQEDVIKYSAMTGQSLFYMGETNLKHKILAIAEEEGAEQASYALKLLQSEGELTIASTGKDATTGRMETQEYHVEGPVMIFLTTTAIDVDEELMNRCIVLTVDENRDQTRAIHDRQRKSQTLEGLLAKRDRAGLIKLHKNAQRLLRPLVVVNPYAEKLTFRDTQTSSRRDHMKYLMLIKTITLLHQYQRELKTTEYQGKTVKYIEATTEDIGIAGRLADQVLGRSVDDLPPQTRRLLMLLDEMVCNQCELLEVARRDYRFTRREVRERTGWGNTQLKVHLNRLMELEYVIIHRGGHGQQFEYELFYDGRGKEGQPVLPGLIDVSKLKQPIKTDEYDGTRSGQKATRSGQPSNRSVPGRPKVGPKSVPGRPLENSKIDLQPSRNGQSHLETV